MEKWIKLDDLTLTRYHDSLPEILVERIKKLYPVIKELTPWSLDEWIDGFCYDMHPGEEIQVWEMLIERFETACKIQGAKTKEEKKNIFKEIFKKSGAGRMEILSKEPASA